MCTKQVILGSLGTTFATRTPDSPACWFDFFREPQPGELDELFKKMKIDRPQEPMPVIESVEVFSYKPAIAA